MPSVSRVAYLANPDNASTVATLAGMKLLLEHASVAKATTQPAIVLSYGRFTNTGRTYRI